MGHLITTAEELAEAIVSDPERVAASLARIHRFGGQVQHCTVLRHSLEVYYRIDADPDSLDAARLWALLHDCHEVLTGDVVRPYVTARLRMDQAAIDAVIVRRLPLLVPQPESMSWESVAAADRAVGDWEVLEIGQDRAPYAMCSYAAKSWVDLVRGFIERRAEQMSGVNYYDAYLCRWRSDVVQFQAAVREFSERTAEQFLRQDRLAEVLQAAEDCTPETHEQAWRAVYECLGWNPDTARERYLERRAGQ